MLKRVFLIIVVIFYSTFVFAEYIGTNYIDQHGREKTIEELTRLVKSKNHREYIEAVGDIEYYLRKGEKDFFTIPALRKSAIPVLINDLKDTNWNNISDPEHEVILIELLGEFRDKRAIPSMMKSVGWVSGGMTEIAFAKMGPAILKPLIKKIRNKRYKRRYSAIIYLGRIMAKMEEDGYSISEKDKKVVKETLKKILKDNKLKGGVITALGDMIEVYDYTDYKDIIPLLKSISQDDICFREKKDKEGMIIKKKYPYREKAKKVLKQLEDKKRREERTK